MAGFWEKLNLTAEPYDLVWASINKMSFKFEGGVWKSRNSKLDASQLGMKLIVLPNWPHNLKDTAQYVKEIETRWDKIRELDREAQDLADEPLRAWMNRWASLMKLRFSAVDEIIWQGLGHNMDSNGQVNCVCRTGNGSEYKVVGRTPDEIVEWMSSVEVEGGGENRLSYIERMIVERVIEFTTGHFGSDTTPIEVLNGDVLSAASAGELYTYEPVANERGLQGFRLKLKNGSRPTVFGYIRCSLESFLARSASRIPTIMPLANDPTVPAFRYLPIVKVEGAWDTWRDWMTETFKISDSINVFMAWLGALQDAENTGKQAMWIHGRGNDGKSKVANALVEYFGQAGMALNGKSMSNQFGAAKLEGKRLIVVGDTKNQKLLQSEWAHNLTGGDHTDIERKRSNSYSAKLFGKLLVFANYLPELKVDEVNQVQRAIVISLRQRTMQEMIEKKMMVQVNGEYSFVGNNSWPKKLKEELPAFLSACWGVYRKLAPTRSDIILSEKIKRDIVTKCADPESEAMAAMCEELFEQGEESDLLEIVDIWALMQGRQKEFGVDANNNFIRSSIYSYFYNVFGSERVFEGRKRCLNKIKLRAEGENTGI